MPNGAIFRVPPNTAYEAIFATSELSWKSFTMDPHSHKGLECEYITDGSCIYYIDGERYTLKKHNFLLFDSSRPHQLVFLPNNPCSLYSLAFTPTAVKPGQLALAEMVQSSPDLTHLFANFRGILQISDGHTLQSSIKAVLGEWQHKNCPCYSNLLFHKLLIDIARISQSSNSYLLEHVRRMTDFIQENYRVITCVEDISSHVGLNKTYMQRIFKEQMGCTVWQYLTNIRMQSAESLLVSTNTNIGELDQLVGINSRQNFYLLFRKRFGCSPQEYRNRYREEHSAEEGSYQILKQDAAIRHHEKE